MFRHYEYVFVYIPLIVGDGIGQIGQNYYTYPVF